nr:hypothetical protein [Tanacetum cinerariifolium]
MDIAIDQQVVLDKALVPHASRLRIGKSNFLLRSNIKSKESTLQVVYDATATVHHHSICFKKNNKKRILNLEYFIEMLQSRLRIPNQQFDELPFEEAILSFLKELGHIGEIKMITDVNINKLHQPWRSFAAVIDKCLSGKTTGLIHPKEKQGKLALSRDDHMFTTIKLISRHQNTQQYSAILPIELTNEAIRNFESYKEYYGIASGAEPPKEKASVIKKVLTQQCLLQLLKVKDSRLHQSIIPGFPNVQTYESDDDDEVNMSELDEDVDDQSDDDAHDDEDKEEEIFDPIGDEMDDEGANKEDDANELYRDMNINLEDGGSGGDGNVAGAVHLARRSPAEGGDSEVSGDGDGVGMARSLTTFVSGGRDMEVCGRIVILAPVGSKRRRAGKETESTSSPKEKTSKITSKSTKGSKSHHKSASESAPVEEPIHTIKDLEEPAHQEFDTSATDDQPIANASQLPDWFQKQAKPPTPDRA